MKKFYIDNLPISKIKNKYNCNTYIEPIILTNEGYIKIIDDQYYLFDLVQENPEIIDDFIDEKPLYIENSYFKKYTNIYQIPKEHKMISVMYNKYLIDKKNKIYFVIEYLNKRCINYYFLANYDKNILQKTLFTFLRDLN